MDKEMAIEQVGEMFVEAVKTSTNAPVYLTATGERQAVIISVTEYERLLDIAEDFEDLAESDEIMQDVQNGQPTIAWPQVLAGLDLT